MAGVLVFIVFFRDTIGSGAGSAFDSVAGTEDIQVKGEEESESDREKQKQAGSAEPAQGEEDAGDADSDSTD